MNPVIFINADVCEDLYRVIGALDDQGYGTEIKFLGDRVQSLTSDDPELPNNFLEGVLGGILSELDEI